MRTILFTTWGPLVRYDGAILHVEDINPQIKTKWQLSRWEMFRLGARAIFASVLPSKRA